jgi:hypothetical protein
MTICSWRPQRTVVDLDELVRIMVDLYEPPCREKDFE